MHDAVSHGAASLHRKWHRHVVPSWFKSLHMEFCKRQAATVVAEQPASGLGAVSNAVAAHCESNSESLTHRTRCAVPWLEASAHKHFC